MKTVLKCPIKINVVLRVLSRKSDGYHDIYSVVWRKTASERLTISKKYGEIVGDGLEVEGASFSGENIVSAALTAARKSKPSIPALEMRLEKFFPPGSGIGAGSGNAGALLKLLKDEYALRMTDEEISTLGADVPFLAHGAEMAEARGRGEKLTPISPPPELSWLLVFPKWSSNTGAAYGKLDEARRGRDETYEEPTEEELQKEARRVLERLRRGERAGRLPNDFWEVLSDERGEYLDAEETAKETSARAWGLCGSGSAFFGLYGTLSEAKRAGGKFRLKKWVGKTFCVE